MSKKIIPTEYQISKITDMANRGCAITHIAEEMSMDRSVIKRLICDYNIVLVKSPINSKGKKYNWTREKELELINLYDDKKIDLSYISNRFGLSEQAITAKAKKLGISKSRDFYVWTSHKIRYLKELFNDKDLTFKDIAQLMGTTEAIIRNKSNDLNLKKKKTVLFNIDELNYINRNKNIKTETDIASHLNRSLISIKLQLQKAGKPIYHSRRIEMPNTDEFSQDISNPMLSNAVIARKYRVGVSVVTRWRRELFGSFKTMVDTWRCKTTAELDFEDILEELDLAYIFQKEILGWKTDFYLGFKTIVEIYSSYHHKLDKVKQKDKKSICELTEAGYKVIVIWDYELKNKENVKHKILSNFRGLPNKEI